MTSQSGGNSFFFEISRAGIYQLSGLTNRLNNEFHPSSTLNFSSYSTDNMRLL